MFPKKKSSVKKVEQTIKVDKIGQWGVLAGGQWLGISQYEEIEVSDFKQGETYKVLISHSQTGKPYITDILSGKEVQTSDIVEEKTIAVPKSAPVVVEKLATVEKPTYTSSNYRQAAHPDERKSIVRQNALAHVFQSQWFANYAVTLPSDKVVEEGLKFAETVENWINR